MCAVMLHQRPYLIYIVDETGHKPTYSSSNLKLLTIKDSHGEEGKAKAVAGLHECKWTKLDSPQWTCISESTGGEISESVFLQEVSLT
jgi:hypothetical protein